MDYFNFIVRKSDQAFMSITKQQGYQVVSLNFDLYSALTTDEDTARLNFTATNHLPSETFETMLAEAKEL